MNTNQICPACENMAWEGCVFDEQKMQCLSCGVPLTIIVEDHRGRYEGLAHEDSRPEYLTITICLKGE